MSPGVDEDRAGVFGKGCVPGLWGTIGSYWYWCLAQVIKYKLGNQAGQWGPARPAPPL